MPRQILRFGVSRQIGPLRSKKRKNKKKNQKETKNDIISEDKPTINKKSPPIQNDTDSKNNQKNKKNNKKQNKKQKNLPSVPNYSGFKYIHIPKTGGVSIKNTLFPKCYVKGEDVTGMHKTALKRKEEEKDWKSCFKFSFVRNPWDLLVSAYSFYSKDIHGKNKTNVSFEQWIRNNAKNPSDKILKILFNEGQLGWLTDKKGNLLVDYIGKFEEKDKSWKYICHQIDREYTPLELYNKSSHEHYSYYYTPELVELVHQIFHKDIDYFGYTFEDEKSEIKLLGMEKVQMKNNKNYKSKNINNDKKFLYMTQTESEIPEKYKQLINDSSDLLVLSWKKPTSETIFYPKSTWTEGRNKLIYHARNLDKTYLYYVLMDDDLEFDPGSFAEYEELMLKYMPAIGNPRIWHHNKKCENLELEAHTIYSYDAALNGFHRDVFFDDIILPYVSKFDDQSWWYSQLILIHLASPLYKDHTLQFSPIRIRNDAHRPYPRNHQFAKIEEWINNEKLTNAFKLLPHPEFSTSIQVLPASQPLTNYRISAHTKKKFIQGYQRQCMVITTINPPTPAIKKMLLYSYDLIIIGDKKTPDEEWRKLARNHYSVKYLSLDDQLKMLPNLAEVISQNHYARKNIGYIYAVIQGYDQIGEMDDDTVPYGNWGVMSEFQRFADKGDSYVVVAPKFPNIYHLYSDTNLWPRGYPLDLVGLGEKPISSPQNSEVAFAYQGLVDGDPDVDAICRLTCPDFSKDFKFQDKEEIYFLRKGILSPGNTQNLLWTPPTDKRQIMVYMYLPSTVNFRFCDILRSYIIQFGFWSMGGNLAITGATAYQDRNDHDIYKDFENEIPVYLELRKLVKTLESIEFLGEPKKDIMTVYLKLLECEIVKPEEIEILKVWIQTFP